MGVSRHTSGGCNALRLVLLVAIALLRPPTDCIAEGGSAELGLEVWVKQRPSGSWVPATLEGDTYLIPTRRSVQFRSKVGSDGSAIRNPVWDFGDPHNRSGLSIYRPRPVHRYTVEGHYEVTLRARDREGGPAFASARLLATDPDADPPAAPAGLTSRAVSPTQIDLSWSAGRSVARHRVFRDGAAVGESAERSYSDTGLSPGTSHAYSLTALDAKGNESPPCDPVSATSLPAGGFAPQLRARAVSATRVELQWNSSKDAYGSGGYAVLRDGREVGRSRVAHFADGSLAPSTRYRYAVRAIDGDGSASGPSEEVTVGTLAPGEAAPFTLAVLPDTQIYAQYHPEIFRTQTAWVRDHRLERNIVFVLHEGDITNTDAEIEWENAVSALSLLDGVVPYALATGNHDEPAMQGGARELSRFNAHFSAKRLSAEPSFGGAFEAGRMDNVFHLFEAGGAKFVILVLEYEPRTRVLDWANAVVTDHPERNVILLTHAYLDHDGRRIGELDRVEQLAAPRSRDASNRGQAIWDGLVRRHPNFLMVLCGHVLGDGTASRASRGDAGNVVYQILANYQTRPRGGSGFLRLLEIDPGRAHIDVTTYSPFLDVEKKDEANRFSFEGVTLLRDTDSPR